MNAVATRERSSALASSEWSSWNLAAFALALAGAFVLAAPHLRHPLWQDEVKTLVMFASDGFLHPFRAYQIPNNHVLFSAVLSVWSEGVRGIAGLRALPMVTFLCSVVLLGLSASRIGGPSAGVFASLLFGVSHVSLGFAAQLRGYGFSWLAIVVAFCALQPFLERGGWRAGFTYAGAAVASVAVLPTNGVIVSVLGFFAVATAALEGRLRERSSGRRIALVLLAPFGGAIAYVGIFPKLLATAEVDYSSWTLTDMAGHWLWATSVDFAWLAPLALLGVAVTLRRAVREPGADRAIARRDLLFAASCLFVPAIGFALLPQLPYARNLVPLLPLWYAALGFFLASGWRVAFRRWPSRRGPVLVALVLAVVAAAAHREWGDAGYVSRARGPALVQNLYDQYYHHEFDPAGMARRIEGIGVASQAVILTDFNGEWVVGLEIERRRGKAARERLVHFSEVERGLPKQRGRVPLYVLTHHLDRANEILSRCDLPGVAEEDLEASTGFFKLYRVPVGGWDRDSESVLKR